MSLKKPKYVTTRRNKDGSLRFYFQVPAHMRPEGWPPSIPLSKNPADMFRQAEEHYNKLKTATVVEVLHTKGGFPWLLQSYHDSPRYKKLGDRTKDLYDNCAEEILAWSKKAGHPHVRKLTRPLAFRFLSLFDDTPTKKRHVYSFLRVLMGHALDLGEIEVNPCLGMRIEVPEAEVHIWTETEVLTIVGACDEIGLEKVGDATLTGFEIGQRQGDILSFRRGVDYIDGLFCFRQSKTKEVMSFPATKRLQERLGGGANGLLIPAAQGSRYRREQFFKEFARAREHAKLPHLVFMHLRHTAIVNLARAGCTHSEIASISGHTEASVAQILRRYLPRDSVVAGNAIAKLENVRLAAQVIESSTVNKT